MGQSIRSPRRQCEQPWRDAEAECLGGVEVDHELDSLARGWRPLHRHLVESGKPTASTQITETRE